MYLFILFQDISHGPDDLPGYGQVQELAAYLFKLHSGNLYLTKAQVEDIVRLWSALEQHDKIPMIYSEAYTKQPHGRFRAKKQAAPGVESTERCVRVWLLIFFWQLLLLQIGH